MPDTSINLSVKNGGERSVFAQQKPAQALCPGGFFLNRYDAVLLKAWDLSIAGHEVLVFSHCLGKENWFIVCHKGDFKACSEYRSMKLELLHQLYDEILIPDAVMDISQ